MKITLKHKASGQLVALEISSDDPDKIVSPKITSSGSLSLKLIIFALEEDFKGKYGHYGHIQDDIYRVTSLDLCAACRQLELFEFVDTSESTVNAPLLPRGAVS